MRYSLSHFEIKARDFARMEVFYTDTLSFVVTDRKPANGKQMVFLSRDPGEHHQIVIREAEEGAFTDGSVDHIAFRVDTLDDLRTLHGTLEACGSLKIETVCHGTTWSVYFRDPEDNRVEFFVDTPWHVAQPVRFPIDFRLSNEELLAMTEQEISAKPEFGPAEDWKQTHQRQLS